MADFVSSLNGVQMDAALMDMAEHNSEAWAVGERNGIPVGSDDVTYQNNAQYYAQQAQSIAPASVTEAVRWDIAQTALTDANKAQARANIDAGKNGAWSNRNLLDNWYFVGGGSQLGDGVFPINQRGQASYAGGAGIDRWSSDSQITLTASGITISANAIYQNQSKEFFDAILGKTVTYSILTTGGEIKSATIQFPSSYPASIQVQEIFNDGQSSIGFALFPAGNGQVIRIIGVPVAAAKLELGSVSTLANDPPPDFGEELRKCQRYFRYVPFTRSLFYLEQAYSIAIKTLEGIQMAGTPTAALVQAGPVIQLSNPPGYATPTGVAVIANYYNTPTVQIGLSAALEGVGEVTETVISLSCEL